MKLQRDFLNCKLKIQYRNIGLNVLLKKEVSIKQTVLENGHIIYDRKWTQEGRKFLLVLLG